MPGLAPPLTAMYTAYSPLVLGKGVGSTTTLVTRDPTKRWSRLAELKGSGLPRASKFWAMLSMTYQLAPPSMDRNRPMPGAAVLASPVPAKMIEVSGLALRAWTARLLMLRLLLGPRSVNGM